MFTVKRIKYSHLNSKQKEIYNFQKVAGMLADYGFNCIKLNDDWQGADFLAYHKDGDDTLRVQLKSRLTINKKYIGKDLYMIFPAKPGWYLVPHDTLVSLVSDRTPWLTTSSWNDGGAYSSAKPSKALRDCLRPYRIGGEQFDDLLHIFPQGDSRGQALNVTLAQRAF
jgi:hypothetical protein